MRSLKLTILAAACALTSLSPAAWCSSPGTRYERIGEIRVPLRDLNLDNAADVRTLLGRLDQAAYTACGGDPKLNDRYRTQPERTVQVYAECRANAVKRAVEQINAPALARAYAEEVQREAASERRCSERGRV